MDMMNKQIAYECPQLPDIVLKQKKFFEQMHTHHRFGMADRYFVGNCMKKNRFDRGGVGVEQLLSLHRMAIPGFS